MNINEIMHRALMAGVGIPEKLKELIDELVEKGELSKSQGARLAKECSEKAIKSGEDLSKGISELISKALEKMNIPARDEVESIKRKVTALSAKIKKLEEASGGKE